MKVAIPTEGGYISIHFARCPHFVIIDIEDGKVMGREEIPNPGHYPGFLPQFFSEKGVDFILCGGMGERAQNLFREKGIQIRTGISGKVDEVIESFIKGELISRENLCPKEEEKDAHL